MKDSNTYSLIAYGYMQSVGLILWYQVVRRCTQNFLSEMTRWVNWYALNKASGSSSIFLNLRHSGVNKLIVIRAFCLTCQNKVTICHNCRVRSQFVNVLNTFYASSVMAYSTVTVTVTFRSHTSQISTTIRRLLRYCYPYLHFSHLLYIVRLRYWFKSDSGHDCTSEY